MPTGWAGTPPGAIIPGVSEHELRRAREALARAEWQRARSGFEKALEAGETPEALEGLGMAAWWLDDMATSLSARERAFQLYQTRAERRGAGRVALALAQDHMYFLGEPAVATGWYRRAHRLLGADELWPEHGWLKLGEADFALSIEHDPVAARALAAEAATIGRTLQMIDLEMTALAVEGLALVAEGQLREGMPRLDEAVTAAASGEMGDFYAIGWAYCCLVQACERVRDFERAAQWCDRAKEYGDRIGFGLLSGICRTQYASVLIWRGAWSDAGKELCSAIQKLRVIRPPLQDEGTVRLAQLRRLQGRTDEADDLLKQCEAHPLALLESSALCLERGDALSAARFAERFLRQAHPADVTERLRGLEALFRARLALGDLLAAEQTVRELQAAAEVLNTRPVHAFILAAQGLLSASAGAHEQARSALEDAVDLYHRSGAPLETGRARLELALTLFALGQGEAAEAEARAARDVFVALGAAGDSVRAEKLLTELGASRAGQRRPLGAGNLTTREIEVLRLVAQGLSNAQIASRLYVSEFTVKRHVANILTKLGLPSRAAAAAHVVRNQLV
jgi:LuxR family transcriptional regulator, maltose regulon positive regulatory protein